MDILINVWIVFNTLNKLNLFYWDCYEVYNKYEKNDRFLSSNKKPP